METENNQNGTEFTVPVIHDQTAETTPNKKIRFSKPNWSQKPALAIFVVGFAAIGAYFLISSFADTVSLTKTWATDTDWKTNTALTNTTVVNNAVTLANASVASPIATAQASINLALGKTAVASSTNTGNYGQALPAGAINDGNMGTRWGSQYSDPQWVYIDLGSTYNINEVKLFWETAYGKAYQIQVSNDANNWTTIYSTSYGTGGTNDLTGLSGSGRYVRMYGTARGTVWGYSIWEMQVYGGGASNTNLAQGKSVSATSTTPDGRGTPLPAINANDGNSTTRWSSAYDDNESITVDLGSVKTINQVVLNWETAYGKAYKIQVSNDNTNWTTIYSTTTNTGGTNTLTGLNGSGRYVRMQGVTRGTGWGYSLWEFKVYGAAPAAANYATSGNIVLNFDGDAGTTSTSPVTWQSFAPTTSLPSGTAISYQARTSSNNTTWSAWSTVTGDLSGLTKARYIQLKANLTTNNAAVTPALQKLVLAYQITTPAAPTVTISASPTSIATGSVSSLTWKSTNASSCTASGGWSGSQAISGNVSTGVLNASTSYSLTCSGPGGTGSAKASVTVTAPPTTSTGTGSTTPSGSGSSGTSSGSGSTSTSSSSSPSGQAMPTGNFTYAGHTFTRTFADDFLTNVALGSWPGSYSATWDSYGDGPDTCGKSACKTNGVSYSNYSSSKVLSVSGGVLDYYLHTENGVHYSAAPLPNSEKPFLYGAYSYRFKSDSLPGFKTAWLLWPATWQWTNEVDFPEGDLSGTIQGFGHCSGNASSNCAAFNTNAAFTSWHTATVVWIPNHIYFLLDGSVVGEQTSNVSAESMLLVLQAESCFNSPSACPANTTAGHLDLDWITMYSY